MGAKNTVSAYNINKKAIPVIIALLVILSISYFGCYCWEKSEEVKYVQSIITALKTGSEITIPGTLNVISMLESLITVFFSILISSILTVLIIEKKNRDDIYSEAFWDICNNATMNIDFSRGKNSPLTFNIVQEIKKRFIPKEIITTAIQKIVSQDKEYYYLSCEMDITCKIEGDYLVKRICKIISIKSFKEKYTFSPQDNSRYILATLHGMPVNNEQPYLDVKKIQITKKRKAGANDVTLDVTSNKFIDTPDTNDFISQKQGYSKNYIVYYTDEIELTNKAETIISTEYITHAPKTDSVYTFRVPCACKKLNFTFRLEGMPEYRLTGNAFGFMDDAQSTFNSHKDNELSYRFEDWIFQRDGICISIMKK